MVQMVGVIVLSLGLPQMFDVARPRRHARQRRDGRRLRGHARRARCSCGGRSRGTTAAQRAGRAHVHDDDRRRAGRLDRARDRRPADRARRSRRSRALIALELAGPFIAERKARTPWHPHHIAERYGLLVIITLGEVILGTVAALNARRPRRGGLDGRRGAARGRRRRPDVRLLVDVLRAAVGRAAGRATAAGVPLRLRPPRRSSARSPRWAPACTSRRYVLEGEAKIGETATVLSVAVPVAIYIAGVLRASTRC